MGLRRGTGKGKGSQAVETSILAVVMIQAKIFFFFPHETAYMLFCQNRCNG